MGWGGFLLPWGGDNIGIPAQFQIATAPAIQLLLNDANAEFDFVLEATPYRTGEITTGFPAAWGAFPWGYGGEATAHTVRYGWRGMTTDTTDTPADTYVPAVLSTPLNYQANIPPSGLLGAAASGFGTIEFVSVNDDDIESFWAGRVLTWKVGGTYDVGLATEAALTYDQYAIKNTLRIRDIEYGEDGARLLVSDELVLMQKTVQQNTYVGAGTFEGDDQLKGQYKPLCYGQVFNAPGILVNNTFNVYQFNDGPVSDITDVRVNGVSKNDVGDTDDLTGWTGGGTNDYKTDKSRGLIRLWTAPDGEVTGDVNQINKLVGLVLRDMINAAGIAELDEGTFNGFIDAEIGIYIGTSPEDLLSLVQSVVESVDGWLYANRSGRIAVGTHPDFLLDGSIYTIEGRREVAAPCVVAECQRLTTPPAPCKIAVAYKRNWTQQDPQGLDASLTELQRQLYSREYMSTEFVNNTGATDINPQAPELFIDHGYITNETDAITVRNQIFRRGRTRRNLFQVTITSPMFQIDPGMFVTLHYDRFGLADGVKGEVLSITEAAEVVTLQVLTMQ